MKRVLLISLTLLFFHGFSLQTQAALNLVGQGTSAHGTYNLIYDTDLNITWYDFTLSTNPWQDQVDWADTLSVTFGTNTYTDWRLPSTFSNDCFGYDCTNSELGHLFYTELGNEGWTPGSSCTAPNNCLQNTDVFDNLYNPSVWSSYYWSGTEYDLLTTDAFTYSFSTGAQENYNKADYGYAIAVRSGLVTVPEPISSLLFAVGGATLGYGRFRRK